MFQTAVMSTSEAIVLFDFGAGQVAAPKVHLDVVLLMIVGNRHREEGNSRKTGAR